ncbi:MAG: AAA family ATPase [Heliobacteriaceae bacterium]|nr:AAA family ATPase [Heliobacteriaceae bacterium]MDD4586828.1 AAA family ATPase [Heliobacteriaceae bacterium]
MARFLAVAGKGGTGKTTVTALLLKLLLAGKNTDILAVDADPNANLHEALGLAVMTTISDLLEDTKNPKAIPPGMTKDIFVQYKLQQALIEGKDLDLLVMGNPQGPGCYCYPNDLLRHYLIKLTTGYRLVVIDTEAGLEHLSRRIVPQVDDLLVISDASVRGVRSARRVREIVLAMNTPVERMGLVVTKTTTGSLADLAGEIAQTGLPLLGEVPYDPLLVEYDLKGRALFDLPATAVAVAAVRSLAGKLGF